MSNNFLQKEDFKIKENKKVQIQNIETNNGKELKSNTDQNLILKENEDKNESEQLKNYGFGIEPSELEAIMGKYKERGDDYKDLLYFEKQNGIKKLLDSLKTNATFGIKSTEGRE